MIAKTSKAFSLNLLLIFCLFMSASVSAQDPANPEPPVPPPRTQDIPARSIRVDVELVLLNVTVTDPYNRLVTGLEREN
ncbi:MAG: hypothetical protein ACRD6I_17375, partial [Candidatus Acidiferrales bacterium]